MYCVFAHFAIWEDTSDLFLFLFQRNRVDFKRSQPFPVSWPLGFRRSVWWFMAVFSLGVGRGNSVSLVLHACLWFFGSSLLKNLELEQLDFKTKHMGRE